MIKLKYGLNIVLDGQWGSTGKGKLCGALGLMEPDLVCSSFGPNAGHTFVMGGKSWVYKALPSSAVTSKCPILIMPDSVVNVDRLMEEIKTLGADRKVYVHPRVAVITDEDKKAAETTGRHIAGTMQGTGHAMAKKMLRLKGNKLAKDILPAAMVRDTCEMVRQCVAYGGKVVFEMSQGFDLSLNHGFDYPYLTSRDITIGAALNSCGCPTQSVGQVIGSIRVFPIRVGNVDGGFSGPHYPDQVELTWSQVTEKMGSPDKIEELTTVTKRVRRVFTFSLMQVKRFVAVNRPDCLFLNFIQYLGHEMSGVVSYNELTDGAKRFIKMIEDETGVPVVAIGTGADLSEMVYRQEYGIGCSMSN